MPPPEYLERYEAICPGAADRVITLAEKQSEHRQKLEASTVTTNNNAMRRGQIFAFIIAMAGITAATIIALNNQPTVASVIGGASLISLVSAFIGGKVSQNKSLKEKSKQVE